ncbi:MAG TPA: hypothetical protein VGQ57_02960, partial [Polyangiaceae bacterium]|nr:hypothetical protein [Polyangiaceae bacterium]
ARAKLLGSPRDKRLAVEWMTTRLVERFDTADKRPLYCKTCHVENLGSPGFRAHLLLTELMPAGAANPAGLPPEPASTVTP